jgi:hypothetical protein
MGANHETGEFESPHLHQQGLVTDQALCLARGRPPRVSEREAVTVGVRNFTVRRDPIMTGGSEGQVNDLPLWVSWRGGQDCCWVTLTIQGMPNLSVHMPNSSPHICFSRGMVTVPPSESFSQ